MSKSSLAPTLEPVHDGSARSSTPPGPRPVAEPVRRRRPRRDLVAVGVALAVLAAAAGGVWLWSLGREATDNAQVEADVVPLKVRTEGVVLRVVAVENQPVAAGDVLLELDPRELEVGVEQAAAALELARARAAAAEARVAVVAAGARGGLTTARARLSSREASSGGSAAALEQARAETTQASAEAARAAGEAERLERLYADGVISLDAVEAARAAAASSAARLAAADARVGVAEREQEAASSEVDAARGALEESTPVDARIATARADTAVARAQVRAAEATLAEARIELENARVTAPTDGVVSRLGARPGQVVVPGQTFAQLVPAEVYVVANFKETQVGSMRVGQRATVTIDAFSGRALEGRIQSFAGGTGARFSLLPPDNATGNFVKVVQRVPVRIALVDAPADLVLRAGLSAHVVVHTSEPLTTSEVDSQEARR